MPCIKYLMFPPETNQGIRVSYRLCFLTAVHFLRSILLRALSKPFRQAVNLKEVTLESITAGNILVTLKKSKA